MASSDSREVVIEASPEEILDVIAKTFLVECFANEIGFPCVKLKNFRSMWVGATEANLERILKILASLTPVGVMVDGLATVPGDRGPNRRYGDPFGRRSKSPGGSCR